MHRQKKYRWKILHRLVKETEINKTGGIIIPPVNDVLRPPHTARMITYTLPALAPLTFIEYVISVYGIQKSEIKLLWKKYTAKINKLTKEK